MRRLGRPPYESMSDESGPPPPAEPSELVPDRCPNCGGKLKFSENRPEGLCTTCGIFVEVLRPSEPKPPVRSLPAKVKIRTGTTKELQLLCRKYGLPSDGTKADLVARLLFFVDEQGWQAKVREKESKPIESTPAPPTEDVASRKQWARFFMDYESELGEEGPEAKDEKSALTEETPTEPRAEPAPVEPPIAAMPEPAPEEKATEATAPSEEQFLEGPPAEGEPTPPAVEQPESPPPPDDFPPPPEAESKPESIPEDEGELPTPPDEIVPAEPIAEPEFEPLPPEPVMQAPMPAERTVPVATAQSVPPRSRATHIQRSRWRRVVYYVGVFYVTIGGAGLVLGSFLHDLFRVPLFGESYVAFGRLNVGAVLIGMILLGVGFAAMAVGMRRTPMRTRGAAGA